MLRLKDITKHNPEAIFLMIGINDLSKNMSATELLQKHQLVSFSIKKESPSTKLYVVSVLPVSDRFRQFEGHANKLDSMQGVNAGLKKMAAQMGHTFIDLFSIMADAEN